MTIRSRVNSKTCFFANSPKCFPFISIASGAAKLNPKLYFTV